MSKKCETKVGSKFTTHEIGWRKQPSRYIPSSLTATKSSLSKSSSSVIQLGGRLQNDEVANHAALGALTILATQHSVEVLVPHRNSLAFRLVSRGPFEMTDGWSRPQQLLAEAVDHPNLVPAQLIDRSSTWSWWEILVFGGYGGGHRVVAEVVAIVSWGLGVVVN